MLHHGGELRRNVDCNCRRVSCSMFPSRLRQRAEGGLLLAARSDTASQSEIGRHRCVLGEECAGSSRSIPYGRLCRLGCMDASRPPMRQGAFVEAWTGPQDRSIRRSASGGTTAYPQHMSPIGDQRPTQCHHVTSQTSCPPGSLGLSVIHEATPPPGSSIGRQRAPSTYGSWTANGLSWRPGRNAARCVATA